MVKKKGTVVDKDEDYGHYPILIVAGETSKYVWPIMLRLEKNNGIKLHACEPHVPTVSRLKELMGRFLEEVRRENIEVINEKNKHKLQVTEVVLEFIPACRR